LDLLGTNYYSLMPPT